MTTTALTWDESQDTVLSQSQQLNNAQIIANYFTTWTPQSISALCGNAHHESWLNPNVWESDQVGDTSVGFGLLQWTPASKLIDWCNAQSPALDYTQGDSQLSRITYEIANNIQWITTSSYPESFQEFTQSTKDTDYLTACWMNNYERPAPSTSNLSDRQSFANTVYTSLDWSGNGGGGGTQPTPSGRQTLVDTSAQKYNYEETLNNMTYVEVKKGDNLSELASKYGVAVSAIKRVRFEDIANKNILYPGEVLLLPKRDTKTASTEASVMNYTVKSGDTLSGLASKFKVPASTIAKNNNISNQDLIKVGQVLKI